MSFDSLKNQFGVELKEKLEDNKAVSLTTDDFGDRTFEALILDCDGVIVDSEYYSCSAWNVVFFREFQIDIGDDYTEILGKSSEDAIKHYLMLYGIPINKELINKLKKAKEKVYFEIANNNLKPIPGIFNLIDEARRLGLKIAVASSGTFEKISFNLEQVGLRYAFDVIQGTEKNVKGKPNPDVFLEAAKKLGVNPAKCIVIEDTPQGIEAAKKAGMFVIGLASTFPVEQLNADVVINKIEELDLTSIISMSNSFGY